MQIPAYLQQGDTIAITCPSGFIPKETVFQSKAILESWGYKVILGKTVGESDNYFSAPDEERRADLQQFLDDPGVTAILMGRGGYGMSRIIDELDFTHFISHPKWICGFSDITVIHNHINTNYGIATLHGPMCSSFTEANQQADFLQSFQQIITGQSPSYPIPDCVYNIPGKAQGLLVGGNLAMLAHLTGSASQVNARDKILFIEDIGEHLYNVDRMLYNLKRAGILSRIKGLVCGGFTDMEDTTRPFGQNIYEIILDHVKHLDIPVCFDIPCGHIDQNYSLVMGATYDLTVSDTGNRFCLLR
ncbi:LD-carboxypeptidase [Taibaiella sp. KBW10]|uniref:S66 peptidase family protein n=1 Tax=Taibaiella sp. KBW10 TaxID=2153357 RepID=UPI000F5A12B3|nr:LD-carboxypeptidase [Taibaiella sp. KBW10]RQO30250.1 LD-carboxypeptidase [Taibaiella sp. KBW10]